MKLNTMKLFFLLTVLMVIKSETFSLSATVTRNSSITDVTQTNFSSTKFTKTTEITHNTSIENKNINSSFSKDMNSTTLNQINKTDLIGVGEVANKQNKQASHRENHGKHSIQQSSNGFKQYLLSMQAKSSENKAEVVTNTTNSNNNLMNDVQQQAFRNFMQEKVKKMSMHLLDASEGNKNSTEINFTLNQNRTITQNSKAQNKKANFTNDNKKTDNIKQQINGQFTGSF